jgi:hypothetical protein
LNKKNKMEVWKQGIELEGNVIDSKGSPLIKSIPLHQTATNWFQEFYGKYYYDDNKPEFPSDPFVSLGSLENHMTDVISKALGKCEREGIFYTLMGCYPFFNDFCSGHIHTSVKNVNGDDLMNIRKKLFNAQPLIALLSANSPIMNNVYRASDVRLTFSSWARFTDYKDLKKDHWMALAVGENGSTLECRLPSSAPLFQIMSIAILIRQIIENEDSEPPCINCKESFNRIVKYGSQAIIPISIPGGLLSYYGVKESNLTVKVTDLWSYYYNANKKQFDSYLETLSPHLRNEITLFYKTVANGYTLSDLILSEWFKLDNKLDMLPFLGDITKRSYTHQDVIGKLNIPEKGILPSFSPKTTIKDLEELVKSIKPLDIKSFDNTIDVYSLMESIKGNKQANLITIFNKLNEGNCQLRDMVEMIKKSTIEYFHSINVIKYDETKDLYTPTDNYPLLIQTLTDCGLI